MSQNARAMNFLRERLQDPAFRPASILTEVAGEGMSNFIEGQKLLLNLAQKEYEIVTKGVKERVGRYPAAVAMTDLMQRSFDTFVNMQQDFLKTADKQTHTWLNAIKAGKPYDPEGLIELARDSFDTFVRTQKKFLNVAAEEMTKTTSGKDERCQEASQEDGDHCTRASGHGFLHRSPEEADGRRRPPIECPSRGRRQDDGHAFPAAFHQLARDDPGKRQEHCRCGKGRDR